MLSNRSTISIIISFLLFASGLQLLANAQSAPQNNPNVRNLVESSDYEIVDQSELANTYTYNLAYNGNQADWRGSGIIKNLQLILTFHDKNTFRIKIVDKESKRWEIPEKFPYPYFRTDAKISQDQSSCTVQVNKSPFSLVVTRKDTKEIIFDTRGASFVFSDLYIELTTKIPSDNVFGFGERNYKFKMTPGTYTIWGRDDPMILEEGRSGFNTYGHHPVGLFRDVAGNFFLTLMRNSNAMDIVIEPDALTYKIVGGVIDLLFFTGEKNPEPVLKSYHNYIGNFTMMPFWSMGFHQSKWGYSSHDIMLDVVNKYNENDIPLDVIWSDIDYMVDKEIFTLNTGRYPIDRMRELMTKQKKKWVPIIDPGVKQMNARGPGANKGLEYDIFLKSASGDNLVGSVWPGRVYFPDFFHPQCDAYWSEMLGVLYNMVPFSGIWLDMNEVANFVDGEENRWDSSRYDRIPYTPGGRALKRKTISLDAVHHDNMIQYNVHSLYNLVENQATYNFLKTKSKLPFILTRASVFGTGQFSAHWTGDNGAYWEYLRASIAGNFDFQIFGVPFVGADICGFMDNTNEELCARWTQLGALYPFARNHHEDRTRNQEPWTFYGNNLGVSVVDTFRAALKTRYSTLKWYYSLFIEKRGSGSIFKPLLFEFPDDKVLYDDQNRFTDNQFMLGSGLLLTPKVEEGDPNRDAYFPKADWYDLFTGDKMIGKGDTERVRNVQTPFDAPVPHFLRGGHILHRQCVKNVLTTEDLNDEFEFIMAFDRETDADHLKAHGTIMGIQDFDDDSVYYRCMADNCLYNIDAKVVKQDQASILIEIGINKQSDDAKVPLDDVGLNGVRLYGLPLEFMGDDEMRIGYAIVQLKRGDDQFSVVPEVHRLNLLADGSFGVDFGDATRIQDGDLITLELVI